MSDRSRVQHFDRPEEALGHLRVERFDGLPGFEIFEPHRQGLPLVVASPHSGRDYPQSFVEAAAISPLLLRRSEDAYVDEMIRPLRYSSVPTLTALFPRAFVDVNREAYELDPEMFCEPLPDYCNMHSPRVAVGLGTLARVTAPGRQIYQQQLSFAEAQARLRACYWPYHQALQKLIEQTKQRFGYCILLDCHSMPSNNLTPARGTRRVDIVLGDAFGEACEGLLTQAALTGFKAAGYRTQLNRPYAGGFITKHYGCPRQGVHVLQIEMNRALYMNERTIARKRGLQDLSERLCDLAQQIAQTPLEFLAAE